MYNQMYNQNFYNKIEYTTKTSTVIVHDAIHA